MYYELNSEGYFVCDIPQEEPPTIEQAADWTAIPPPQPVDTPYMVGERNEETGEWTGVWEDAGPAPSPAPLPELPSDSVVEMASPTVAEWNALCEAANAPELRK